MANGIFPFALLCFFKPEDEAEFHYKNRKQELQIQELKRYHIEALLIDNFDDISEGDIVIINMTLHGRIEVPIGDKIFNILSSYEDAIKIIIDGDEKNEMEKIETVINFQHHFSGHQFYKDRHKKRFEFIKNRLTKDTKIKFLYLWSLEDDGRLYGSFQTIIEHTKGKVDDTHFSFKGHLDFAHFLHSLISKNKII